MHGIVLSSCMMPILQSAGLLDDLFRRDRERASADDAELKRASEQERDAAATSLNKITRAAFVTLAVAISANASSTPSTSPDAVTFRLLPQKNNGNLPTAARQELLDAPKVADPRATKAATKEEKPPSVLSSILQVSVLSVVAEAIGDTLQWLYYKRRLDNLKK